jgi:hypothetical protein
MLSAGVSTVPGDGSDAIGNVPQRRSVGSRESQPCQRGQLGLKVTVVSVAPGSVQGDLHAGVTYLQ